ncbi:hypothetical protein PIB30_086724 [Stylosanthes scabra]|uniref:Uncharacterized protein n=1 Tax=Stylosanthes scabra TaxID=79078 RepID=A0ABU6YSQ5_9FABA|nr:hypothetical protein [Stylosanthes scabra]
MDKGGIPAKLGIILTIVAMATLAVRILCQHVRLTMMSFNIRLERDEILENQKRLEAQLLTIAELTSSIIRRFAPPMPPRQEEGLGAITLRSGTQLKEPTGESPNSDSITSEERNLQRNVEYKEKLPTTEQETTSGHNERVVNPNLNSLPFRSAAKKTRKAKPADPRIVELLKKVEVTMPLFESIQQMPK